MTLNTLHTCFRVLFSALLDPRPHGSRHQLSPLWHNVQAADILKALTRRLYAFAGDITSEGQDTTLGWTFELNVTGVPQCAREIRDVPTRQ